ncbi:MAG: hypothetical protein PVF89_01320 [Lysobacterales bacterium]|jgi:hypothetical protein
MKKLMLIPLLLLLSGCVTYYYPESGVRDGVYYAQDDPSYVDDSYVTGSAAYSAGYANYAGYADYYPWASLDSFYLGYGGYSRSRGGIGWSFGLSYGYTPWYAPYYGYYSPWYAPYYPRYYGPYYSTWWPYYRSCRHRGYCGYQRNHPRHDNRGYQRGGHDRYSRGDWRERTYRGGTRNRSRPARRIDRDSRNHGATLKRELGQRDARTAPARRYVTTAPSGEAHRRGMVVRNRAGAKDAPRRVQPRIRGDRRTLSVQPNTAARRSDYRSRQASGEVVYRAGAKQGRSRPTPVRGAARSLEIPNAGQSRPRGNSRYQVSQPLEQVRYRRNPAPDRAVANPAQNNVRRSVRAPRSAPPASGLAARPSQHRPSRPAPNADTGQYTTAPANAPSRDNRASNRNRRR